MRTRTLAHANTHVTCTLAWHVSSGIGLIFWRIVIVNFLLRVTSLPLLRRWHGLRARTQARTHARTQARALAGAPACTLAGHLAGSPSHTLVLTLACTLGRFLARTLVRILAHTLARTLAQTQARILARSFIWMPFFSSTCLTSLVVETVLFFLPYFIDFS